MDEITKVYWTTGEVADSIGGLSNLYKYQRAFPWLGYSRSHKKERKQYSRKQLNSIVMVHYLKTQIGMSTKGITKSYELGYGPDIVQVTYHKVQEAEERQQRNLIESILESVRK